MKNSVTKDFRTLGIAYKKLETETKLDIKQETGMTFLGFLTFLTLLKPGILDAINNLKNLGISLKIITGDNHFVAANVSQKLGLTDTKIITGPELRQMSDNALLRRSAHVNVFAEIEPNQKERIILALKKAGNVVGYMGDGINDASALACCRCWHFC